MKGKDIIEYTVRGKMPNLEQVRENCHNQAADIVSTEKRQKPHYRRISFVAAMAMMLLLTVGVGAYYINILFFAPGYGILQDADFTIYATKDKVMLGNFIVDAVTRTVDENESTVCIWLFQSNEIESFLTEEERISGILPTDFKNIVVIFDDGTEIKSETGSVSIPGFATYIFRNTPDANTFILRDGNGYEAEITLEDISKTEYANLKGIEFDDVSLTVVPLSGTGNIFAGELTDKFTLNISKYTKATSLYASFFLEANGGDTGYANGHLMLNNYKNDNKYNTINVAAPNYGMNADKLMLSVIRVTHQFYGTEHEYSIIVPNEGESIDCNITMFDAEGIKYKIKSIKNENGILICETETTDNVKNIHRTKAIFSFSIGIYEDFKYSDYGLEDEQGNPNGTVYKVLNYLTNNTDSKYNWDILGYNLKTHNSKIISPGDEVVILFESLFYGYQWDKKSEQAIPTDWNNPAKNLGVINLK